MISRKRKSIDPILSASEKHDEKKTSGTQAPCRNDQQVTMKKICHNRGRVLLKGYDIYNLIIPIKTGFSKQFEATTAWRQTEQNQPGIQKISPACSRVANLPVSKRSFMVRSTSAWSPEKRASKADESSLS